MLDVMVILRDGNVMNVGSVSKLLLVTSQQHQKLSMHSELETV